MPFSRGEVKTVLDRLIEHYEAQQAAFIGPRQPPQPTIEDRARDLKEAFECMTPPNYHAAEIIQGLLDRIEEIETY